MHQVSNSSLRFLRLYFFDRHINFSSMSSAEAKLETEAEVISDERPTKKAKTTLDIPTDAGGSAVPAGTDSDKAKSTVPEDPVKRHLRRLQQRRHS